MKAVLLIVTIALAPGAVALWLLSGSSGDPLPSVTSLTQPAPANRAFEAPSPASRGGGVRGTVDSSRVSRWGVNSVYIYPGVVEPDDIDGAEPEPVAVARVTQVSDGCGWKYQSSALPAGEYTLAFSAAAGADRPDADDHLRFSAPARVVLNDKTDTATHDFPARNVLRVGSEQPFKTIRAAARVAKSGDVIEVAAAMYPNDIVVWRQDDITVRGVGGRAHLAATRLIEHAPGDDARNGKAIWVVKGNGFSAENIEFSGAEVAGGNGAGIRSEGEDLTVCNGYFHNNQMGLLGRAKGTMLIEHSEFARTGSGTGSGLTHNFYLGSGDGTLVFRYNYSHHARVGHNLKTRAPRNYILYNRIMDEADGNASYQIDIPNGGIAFLLGNTIQQSGHAENSTLVSFGAEGLTPGAEHRLHAAHNTLVNDHHAGVFFRVPADAEGSTLINNVMVGKGRLKAGHAQRRGNILSLTDPGFAARDSYDYRLTATARKVIDQGATVSSVDGFSMRPRLEYRHPLAWIPRKDVGTPDPGAFALESRIR